MTEAPAPPTRGLFLRPARSTRIAAVHALPSWLADHPEVDTPDVVRASRVVTEREYPMPLQRVAAVRRFADQLGLPLGESPLWVWATVPIGVMNTHGVSVEYALYASKANERVLPIPPLPGC